MITPLGPDILECKFKWYLGSTKTNKASGGDGIPAVQLQILKDEVVKVLNALHVLAKLENSAVAIELEKVNFHSNLKDEQHLRMLQLLHNCTRFTW